MIAIINYGMGNLTSVKNAFEYVGHDCTIVDNPAELKKYDKAILPGVGAFGQAMENLNKSGMTVAVKEYVASNKPLIGICLGMQLMLETSCELGQYDGLALVKGHVRSLKDKVKDLPVPHVGWNSVKPGITSRVFNNDTAKEGVYYFVHSFYCDLEDKKIVTGTASYGIDFDVAFEKDNLFACQFHPEKSQKDGLEILKKFGQL